MRKTHLRLTTRHRLIIFAVIISTGILFTRATTRSAISQQCQHIWEPALSLPLVDHSSAKVAIVQTETYHDEVEGAIIHDFVNMGIQPTIIRAHPYRYGFENIIHQFYHRQPVEVPVTEFGSVIKSGRFDVAIFVTCSWKLDDLVNELVASQTWVVCVVHHVDDKHKDAYRKLAKTGRFSLVTLSEHTALRQRELLEKWGELSQAPEWDTVDVQIAVPVFTGPKLLEYSRTSARVPNRIVIQGAINNHRRDYDKLFRDLVPLMTIDLASWGYFQEAANSSFQFLPQDQGRPKEEPFSIHLLGQMSARGKALVPRVPVELKHVVHFHQNLPYMAYYELLASMDLLLPAFHGDGYYINTASSSIPAALIGRVPVLASSRHMRAYGYLAPPAAIMRPTSMSDAKAIQLLRLRQNPMPDSVLEENHETLPDWDGAFSSVLERNKVTWFNILRKALSKNVIPSLHQ
ncbi:hypothetical protein CALVIDRAFT_602634 [Calocera viscosa TUFC12733]|uniref:Glycosyltransferase family 1 protein n=1 Tax=Calocera viscosa (strain TUFC12733) TaxID=1330018 RepID=A0A167GRH5_CALVF|nr:hypothetical protein CALVIDRAFT_602634 [Calocera viscosa TUFC12733]